MERKYCNHIQPLNNRGFTLIELIITIAVLSFGVIGVYSAFSPVVALSYTISSRTTAAYLGQEGFEIVRNIRDNNFIKKAANPSIPWYRGLADCALGCQADYKTGTAAQTPQNYLKPYDQGIFLKLNQEGFYAYDSGTDTPFTRKIIITWEGSDILKVHVLVLWNYNGQGYNFETYGYLYNWN